MVNPRRTILLLFYIGAMSALVMLISPYKIPLFGAWQMKVPSFEDLQDRPVQQADLGELLALEEEIDSLQAPEENAQPRGQESGFVVPDSSEQVQAKKVKYPLQFPTEEAKALDGFFASLRGLSSANELIRVMHIGDSQLEGDRISDYLRNRLQKRFGGCGVGLVPVRQPNDIMGSIYQESSENWVEYRSYGAERKQPMHKNYGIMGSYFNLHEEGNAPAEVPYKGTVRYVRARKVSDRFRAVERIGILYRPNRQPLSVAYSVNSGTTQNFTASPSDELKQRKVWVENGDFRSIELAFESKGNPDVYGLTFDCRRGIALDNVAMRGSSGVEFTQINRNFLREQLRMLNVKMMVLQFGVNVVPAEREEYGYYEYSLKRQIEHIKSAIPDMAIVVIGVSDMSKKVGTAFESYPNITLIRDAQKNAALATGCAFWDLYEAMGGQNSMVSWVNVTPPLASTDYTHFTSRGARLVGEMFYKALIKAYNDYKIRERNS